jgi:hypothetical protein
MINLVSSQGSGRVGAEAVGTVMCLDFLLADYVVCVVFAGVECAGQYSSAPAAFQACPEEPVGQVGGQATVVPQRIWTHRC